MSHPESSLQSLPPPEGANACPRCGGPLRPPAGVERMIHHGLICAQCGYTWMPRELERSGSAYGTNPRASGWKCSRCGAVSSETAKFCGRCGLSRSQESLGIRQQATTGTGQARSLELEAMKKRLGHAFDRIELLESRLAAYGIPVTSSPERQLVGQPSLDELVSGREAVTARDAARAAAVQAAPVAPIPATGPISAPGFPPLPETRAGGPRTQPGIAPRPARPSVDFEQLISGRGLAFVGGLAILLGALFFLSLAFSRGWIGPSLRVVIGVASATLLIAGGWHFFGKREAVLGHVLTATGLGVMSLSMFAATRLYDLISVEVGVTGMLAAAFVAAMIAIRANLQVVAAYGIVSALAAPPVLGAQANGVTVALIGAALAGTTLIALYRSWRWLPPLAFLLTAPQLADWILDDPRIAAALPALGSFWLLHAIAAGGEAFRFRKSRLQPTSATLLVADAAYLIWGGFELLDGNAADWRGAFLLAVAIAHVAIGTWFMRDRGDRYPFGMLAFGTGVAALTMAVPVQFGGSIVPLAWASEGVALAWLSSRLRNPFGAVVAAIMGSLAVVHILSLEYPANQIGNDLSTSPPFLNGDGLSVAYLIGALLLAGYFSRMASVRQTLAAVAVFLAAYVMPFELSNGPLVAGLSIVAAIAALAYGWKPLAAGPGLDELPGRTMLAATAISVWIAGVVHLLAVEYPPADLQPGLDERLPFLHGPGLALVSVLGAAAVGISQVRRPSQRFLGVLTAFALVLYVIPYEFSGAALVGVWTLMAVIAQQLAGRVPWLGRELAAEAGAADPLAWERTAGRAGMALPLFAATALAILHLVTIDYPIEVVAEANRSAPPFLNGAGLALAFALAAVGFAAHHMRALNRIRLVTLGFALIVWAMPFELSGTPLIAGWALLAIAALRAERWSETSIPASHRDSAGSVAPLRRGGLGLIALAAWGLAAANWLLGDLAVNWIENDLPANSFRDLESLAALILIATAAGAALIGRDAAIRTTFQVAGVTTAALLLPYETGNAATVVGWSALAVLSLLLNERDRFSRLPYLIAASALGGLAALTTIGTVAPLTRLSVDRSSEIDHRLLWSGATAALGALALASAFVGRRYRSWRRAYLFDLAGGALAVYLLSIGMVDHFQGQVGAENVATLEKRAQVALSILWAVLGGGTFAVGIAKSHRSLRLAGLGLLGLATGKVFVYDLASLDASYRVPSFIALGVLLLVSSYLYQRFVGPLDREEPGSDQGPPAAAGMAHGD